MREETDVSLLRIGAELGGRDHSTVLHACDKINREMQVNDEMRREVAAVRELIYADVGARRAAGFSPVSVPLPPRARWQSWPSRASGRTWPSRPVQAGDLTRTWRFIHGIERTAGSVTTARPAGRPAGARPVGPWGERRPRGLAPIAAGETWTGKRVAHRGRPATVDNRPDRGHRRPAGGRAPSGVARPRRCARTQPRPRILHRRTPPSATPRGRVHAGHPPQPGAARPRTGSPVSTAI